MKTLFNALFALSVIAGVTATTVSSSQAFDGKSFFAEQERTRY